MAQQLMGSSSYIAAALLSSTARDLVEAIDLDMEEGISDLVEETASEAALLEKEIRALLHPASRMEAPSDPLRGLQRARHNFSCCNVS